MRSFYFCVLFFVMLMSVPVLAGPGDGDDENAGDKNKISADTEERHFICLADPISKILLKTFHNSKKFKLCILENLRD
ncbi:MAG: hypothetical protein LBD57_01960 [Endomicrobium sp.]|uniref:hypothetical protein n=1 Tax=Candidatus Endomicrobiellum cubanum TaxID=3242325 RepID=UPI00281873AD|nr:hypothetical protein [Endomicrobium sp.]